MNIFNGSTAAGTFLTAYNSANTDVLVFHDVLSSGPVQKFTDFELWKKDREAFWRQVNSDNAIGFDPCESFPRDLYHHFSTLRMATKTKLWIGTGLSDQLLLVFIIHLFIQFELSLNTLQIIQFELTKSRNGQHHYPVQGVGLVHTDELKKHPKPITLTAEQIDYAELAWHAFTDTTPEKYIEFMAIKEPELPLLKQAMSYLYHRYPSAANGLTVWDEALLTKLKNKGTKATSLIGDTMGFDMMNGLDYLGDNYLFSRLKNMACSQLKSPIIRVNPTNESMRNTQVEITAFGQLLLNNKANAITENGINDWVGGVNLNSKNNNVWVKQEGMLTFLEQKNI